MTLNQIIKRIQVISLAHKQVRSFTAAGLVTDFENEKTRLYPAVTLLTQPGTISIVGKSNTFNFQMFIEDLVNVASDAKANEQDVISDMVSIAEDLVTQFANSVYTDWGIGDSTAVNFAYEDGGDQAAGVRIDFSIKKLFPLNICAVPSNEIIIPIYPVMDNTVYNYTYQATGGEGFIITTSGMGPNAPDLNGKEILFVGRENNVIIKNNITSLDSIEWKWDYDNLTVGTAINPGERFTILYRNRNV